ncbi:MAG TPA: molybdopterin-dependent oxidoreductase [Polyangiaceae bacterium]|jgi:anaerobic selenocysteine-containing dehydrogenase|nr:molybdopterin-dependent oxidoreductase [Polyangiaceae bacterium]
MLRRTICNRDCPDACGIVATVEDGRVVRLQGDREHPVTGGFLCYRTNQFLRTQYSKQRLTAPLLRKNGRLSEVSWSEALDYAAERLLAIRAESGPAAIFHYRSGGTLGLLVAQASELFFEKFGPVTVKRGDICSGAGEAAQELDFGVSDSSDLFDLENARHILLWGKNVCTSSPHTIVVLKRSKAACVLIDPLHHQSAALCERHVQLKPGADFALAMGIAAVLFERDWVDSAAASYCDHLDGFRALAQTRSVEAWCEEADVTVESAVDLARRLHEGPTTILIGWGMARRLHGAAIVRAVDALAAVSGNLGVPGGGASYYFRRRRAFRKLAEGLSARTICEPLFGPEVLRAQDPPIRAVWITAANPVAMLPDSRAVARALETRELVIVVDSWLSDTAERAHLVLPTTTLLEADDLLGAYGHHHLGQAQPVVAPPEGVKSDLGILQELALRVGLGDTMAGSTRAWKERLLGDGLSLDDMPMRNPLAPQVLFEGRRFPTPTGRVNLIHEPPAAPVEDPSYPLQLLSVSTPRSQSSQWAKEPPKPTSVTVHPDAARGIAHGALAVLESPLGSLTVRVEHDDKQRRDVAIVPKGGHLRDASCANVLVHARITDLGEGGALYDERVRLRPLV